MGLSENRQPPALINNSLLIVFRAHLMHLLDRGNAAELLSQLMETFLVGLTSHPVIHIRPFGVFTLGGVEQMMLIFIADSSCSTWGFSNAAAERA